MYIYTYMYKFTVVKVGQDLLRDAEGQAAHLDYPLEACRHDPHGGLRAGNLFPAGSYLRPIDSCITQLKAQGPSRTCDESKEEEGSVAYNTLFRVRFRAKNNFKALNTLTWQPRLETGFDCLICAILARQPPEALLHIPNSCANGVKKIINQTAISARFVQW